MTDVAAPQPGTPEHDAAMAAKVDATTNKAIQDATPTPIQAPPVEAPKDGTENKPEDAPKDGATEDDAKEALKDSGIDYSALQAEYDEGGKLSDASYEALAKVGIPKEVVDSFIANREAAVEIRQMKGYAAAGGEEQYQQMSAWAAKSLSKEELTAYNDAVTGSSEADALKAIEGLRGRFEKEYGKAPKLLGGSPAAASQGYASRAEMVRDMRDPKYSNDPAFRAAVEAKIGRTTAF